MNNHQIRVFVAGIVAVLVVTALFLLLEATPLTITAYCFTLLAIIEFFGALCFTAGSDKKTYITNAAFPFVANTYAAINIGFCIIAVVLERIGLCIPVPWFCFIQVLFIAFFVWRLLAMRSGQELIQQAEKDVRNSVLAWKTVLADAQSILERTDAASRKDVSAVCDAVRYADPMSAPELAAQENAIQENLIRLGMLVDDKKTDEVAALCITLQRQIKDRNVKIKLLK